MIKIKQAEILIKLARQTLKSSLDNLDQLDLSKIKDPILKEKRGLFVTLLTYPAKELRGCVGFPEPIQELDKATIGAAQLAGFSDPRFSPLTKPELAKTLIELSILTKPELIKNKKLDKIKIGRDGLICQQRNLSGLLLPQVATEHKLDKTRFLEAVCQKAGLPPNSWKDKNTNLLKFQAQIFSEEKPGGKIKEKQLE